MATQQTVRVEGTDYVIVTAPTEHINQFTVMGVADTVDVVRGSGYKVDGDPEKLYEIVWMIDGDPEHDDFEQWVKNWDEADAVFPLDD